MDNISDLYRYSPQLGYYRLIEFLTYLFGADVKMIPAIMKNLSAVMGTLIPVAALFLFKNELSTRTRWLAAFILAANPIIWKSSQYGNTAMVATGLAVLAITLLSNKPKIKTELLALVIFTIAIVVRADTVLLGPLLAFLFYRNHNFAYMFKFMAGFGIALIAIYGLLFLFDPRLDSATSAVSAHFTLFRKTMFWEYLIWAISPIVLIFAVTGLRDLLDKRTDLLLILLIWLVPPMAFYFTSITTPRYFLLATVPLAILAATGVLDIKNLVQKLTTKRIAVISIFAAAFIHLLIGLGQFPSAWRASPLYGPNFRTDDGFMPTGALIYDTYLRDGFLYQSFNNPGFAKAGIPYWEGVLYNQTLDVLTSDKHGNKTTLLLFADGLWHAFFFHAQERGAKYISHVPASPSNPYATETWLKLGDNRIMTVNFGNKEYAAVKSFDVKEGDEIWFFGTLKFPDKDSLKKLPAGLVLKQVSSFNKKVSVYRIERG